MSVRDKAIAAYQSDRDAKAHAADAANQLLNEKFFDRFRARAEGAIKNMCGDDSVPYDMSVRVEGHRRYIVILISGLPELRLYDDRYPLADMQITAYCEIPSHDHSIMIGTSRQCTPYTPAMLGKAILDCDELLTRCGRLQAMPKPEPTLTTDQRLLDALKDLIQEFAVEPQKGTQ